MIPNKHIDFNNKHFPERFSSINHNSTLQISIKVSVEQRVCMDIGNFVKFKVINQKFCEIFGQTNQQSFFNFISIQFISLYWVKWKALR